MWWISHRDRQNRTRLNHARSLSHPSWKLAYGKVDHLKDAVWQDETLAFFAPASSAVAPGSTWTLSPSQQFVVMGEAWLSQPLTPDAGFGPNNHPRTDLEQIAAAWDDWGVETFHKLVGQFCVAAWDQRRKILWLGRDRIGGKTIYYTTSAADPQTQWFAPILRSLNPHHNKALDPIALRDYLCCAFVPGSRTLWQQVRELRPGQMMGFPGGQRSFYWQAQEQSELGQSAGDVDAGRSRSLEDWAGQLRSHLDQAVQDCLPQHQPVGVFLSGGLDSSCVAAIAAQYHTPPIHSYSIHFGPECPNELEFSSVVAQHCGTEHHILEITFEQMWEHLPKTLAYLDDPIGDPLTVPNLLLGQLASQSVKTILNGEGGDPCFGGPKNQPMLLSKLYGGLGPRADQLSNNPQAQLHAYLQSFQKCAEFLPQLLKPEVWRQVQSEASVFSEELESEASYLNRLMLLNIKFKGADHILTKVNNLTRAAGVMGRSPLFDQRIVELSMAIPPEYKLSGVQEKAVLKEAVADLLPGKIVYRPKSGMMVPVQLGFRQYWQKEARRLLLNRKAAIAPYLNPDLIQEWLNYRGDPWQRYGTKLWLLTSLELWLQVNR